MKLNHSVASPIRATIAAALPFQPAVARYAQGMLVSVPLALWALPKTPTAADLHAVLAERYAKENLQALAHARGATVTGHPVVMFVSPRNASAFSAQISR